MLITLVMAGCGKVKSPTEPPTSSAAILTPSGFWTALTAVV